MKRLTTITLLVLCIVFNIHAANTVVSVSQVTSAVTVDTDVDYTITGSNPFATAGSVDLTDTEHAVLIIQKIKPSVVLKNWMGNVYINGKKAVNGTNCQVRMYNHGTIIFPYDNSDFHPLVCYTEKDFQGESCTDYSEGHSGGFMKTLTTNDLNNQIKSFKLKRGYMVTFALGTAGWGYSRCFIADKEDLEINMPDNMSGRASSYRLFKWFNARKAGIADCNDEATISALNASWCYRMWPNPEGFDKLPDCEYIPHHYKEGYPSISALGSADFSCHLKNNNEPGNSADEAPCSVDDVLGSWQTLMRTGMRLLSESSHDGSMNHLKSFIDSIDARGWRCDVLDLHCYWPANQFYNFGWYSSNYGNGRPIWISEWVWGASWNHNGIFGSVSDTGSFSEENQKICYNGTKPILDALNSNALIERYAYWNSEAVASKVYHNGTLSTLGKYYADMDDGLGYRADKQYTPKVVYSNPTNLTGTYTKSSGAFALSWNDNNGDMLDSMVIECRRPGETKYTQLKRISLKDKNSGSGALYNYTDYPEAGANYYRVAVYGVGSKAVRYSGETSVTVGSSKGDDNLQYGMIDVTNTNSISIDFDTLLNAMPAVFTGLYTLKNSDTTPVSLITNASTRGFSYQMKPWTQSGSQDLSSTEQVPFLAMVAGNYSFGDVNVEIDNVKVNADTVQVTFTQPFAEGVVPVVITELKPSLKTSPINVRIWDVTNTGFKATAFYEAGLGKELKLAQTMNYFACTPGQGKINSTLLISAGVGPNPVYGTAYRQEAFRATNPDGTISEGADTLYLKSPYIFGAPQTYNYPTAAVIRRYIDMKTYSSDGTTLIYGTRVKRIVDSSAGTFTNNLASGDKFGWICLSSSSPEDVNGDGLIDTQDVLSIYAFMQNASEVTSATTEDVNGDGLVDTQDVLAVYGCMSSN